MTLEKILEEILKNLSDEKIKKDFSTAINLSITDEERAYNLGLFFNKLKNENIETFSDIKRQHEKLTEYLEEKNLDRFFSLKEKRKMPTRMSAFSYIFLFSGLLAIILGILNHVNGQYSVAVNIKTQQPVYRTGLYVIIFGIAIFIMGLAPIFKISKNKKFYSDYQET